MTSKPMSWCQNWHHDVKTKTWRHARKSSYTPSCKATFPSPGRVHGNSRRIWKKMHHYTSLEIPIQISHWHLSSASIRKEPEFKLEKTYMNFEGEKLSTKFYKYILGVHKRATNLAVIGDLGRTPYLLTLFTPYNLALSFLLTAGHDTDGCRRTAFMYKSARIIYAIFTDM